MISLNYLVGQRHFCPISWYLEISNVRARAQSSIREARREELAGTRNLLDQRNVTIARREYTQPRK